MAIKINRSAKSEQFAAVSLKDTFAEICRLAKDMARPDNRLALGVVLNDEVYQVYEPLTLSVDEVPELAYVDLTITARGDGVCSTVTGARTIPGKAFAKVEGKPYYKYQFAPDENGAYPKFRELMVNKEYIPVAHGERMHYQFASPPEEKAATGEEVRGAYLPIELVRELASEPISGAECRYHHCCTWRMFRIKGVDLNDTRELNGETFARVEFLEEDQYCFLNKTKARLPLRGSPFYFFNSPAFLTPGTFTYDYMGGTLYYYPLRESDLTLPIEYPVAEQLFVFKGLSNLTVEKLRFMGTTCRYACDYPYMGGQASRVFDRNHKGDKDCFRIEKSAIFATAMNRFTVKNCVFEQLGGNGIFMPDNNVAVRIRDNIFQNVGMTAVTVGNFSADWLDPKNRLFDIRIENNYFEHICCDYAILSAITVGTVDGLSICHNTIKETGYMAMHIGWTWTTVPYALGEKVNIRDAEIAYNYIENYMMIAEDGGAIYVLGANCNHDNPRRFNSMHDNYATAGTMRIWGRYAYYMDATSTNWDCRHNVTINANHPVFSQPCPWACSWHNHMHENYCNTPVRAKVPAPDRDVMVYNNVIDTLPEDEFLAKYEEARKIRAAAGCSEVLLDAVRALRENIPHAGAAFVFPS